MTANRTDRPSWPHDDIIHAWWVILVELRGFEPLTPTLPVWCATNCAIAPEVVLIEITPQREMPQNRCSGVLVEEGSR